MIRASLAIGLLPSEFLTRATPFDLTLLQAYDSKFLLGDVHNDFNTAMWCSTYVNTKLKTSATPTKPTDFMPLLPVPPVPPTQDPKVMKQMFLAFAASFAKRKPH